MATEEQKALIRERISQKYGKKVDTSQWQDSAYENQMRKDPSLTNMDPTFQRTTAAPGEKNQYSVVDALKNVGGGIADAGGSVMDWVKKHRISSAMKNK